MKTDTTSNLNLARRLRPQTFDAVIGQDLSISMLKNSLYQKIYFPAYVLTGQRGCGKTTSARIFAAALNCDQLSNFQKDPRVSIPCLTCTSCQALRNGNHPDFIEIDAASNTGVDNVRTIIEAASFVPIMGQKKIYLIDEAHMLSKAAFNAFLKLLEEPPTTALFMLATTELHKIPDTVLSRCIKLSFNALNHDILTEYLKTICAQEGIIIDDEALSYIVDESEGSARDALSVIEQMRYANATITKEAVLMSLGKVSTPALLEIVGFIVRRQPKELLQHIVSLRFEQQNPQYFWHSLLQIFRGMLWLTYDKQALPAALSQYHEPLTALVALCSPQQIHGLLQLFWSQEPLLLQTHKKHMLIELIMLQACEQQAIPDPEGLRLLLEQYTATNSGSMQQPAATAATTSTIIKTAVATPPIPSATPDLWQTALEKLANIVTDPMLMAIFKQACLQELRPDGVLVIALKATGPFLTDKLHETRATWQPVFKEVFNGCSNFLFVDQPQQKSTPQAPQPEPSIQQKSTSSAPPPKSSPSKQTLSVDGNPDWPLANLLLKRFPGTLEKVIAPKEHS